MDARLTRQSLILPLTALLYLSAYLDRGNAGNAKLQGLLDILGDNADHKFSVVLMSFYVTYIAFNVPGTLLGNIIQPNYALAIGAMIWGVASAGQAGATNFAGMVVCRLFIGIGEAGFGAAVSLYYALWYRREEIAVRISLYVGAGSLAGCFGESRNVTGLICRWTHRVRRVVHPLARRYMAHSVRRVLLRG